MSRDKRIEEIANTLWHIPENYSTNNYNDCKRIAEIVCDSREYHEQKTGEWIKDKKVCFSPFCSSCGAVGDEANYCHHCGAKMKNGHI